MILNAIADFNNKVAKEHKDTNLELEFIDKNRINQVILNLLTSVCCAFFTFAFKTLMITGHDINRHVREYYCSKLNLQPRYQTAR